MSERPEYRARIRAVFMRYGPKMTKDELQAHTGIERRVLGRTLSSMIDQGELEKKTKYWLMEDIRCK